MRGRRILFGWCLVVRRDVDKSGEHFFSVLGKRDLAGIAGQAPLKMRRRRIF